MVRPIPKLPAPLRRHPWLALVGLVLAVLGMGAAAVYSWAEYHLHAAQRALKAYRLEEAQRHLDLCLKVRSGSAAVHLLAAQTARRRDAYQDVEPHLHACSRLGGMKEAIAQERSLLTAQQGNLDHVERSLQSRTGPNDPEAVLILEALAKGYVTSYRPKRALMCLNILLNRDPRHPQALLIRARLWEDRALKGEKDLHEDALRDYEQAVALNATFEARLGLAGVLYQVGRSWEALSLYEQLRMVQPAHPKVLLGLARCRYSLHEVD